MPVTHRFSDRLRLLPDFEPAGLADDMANSSNAAWIEHFVKQNYEGD